MEREKLVTIVYVPRERFSATQCSLESILTHTNYPHEFVCVDGGSPDPVRQYLEDIAHQNNFTLVRSDSYLSPNEARNLALQYVKTRYVVFVDNDVLVSPGWLDALIRCAEETGAWMVGPLCCEGDPERERIHMFGGEISVEQPDGRRKYFEKHHLKKKAINDVDEALVRRKTELIEFHTMLVRMKAFDVIGPLDEGLLSSAEHADLCLSVKNAGQYIYLEPEAKITYLIPEKIEEIDREFFKLRWSDAWNTATIERLMEKYKLPRNDPGLTIMHWWLGKHRRRVTAPLTKIRKMLSDDAFKSLEWRVAKIETFINRLTFRRKKVITNRRPKVTVIRNAEVNSI
jgi:GT2 family glycosyltransferase